MLVQFTDDTKVRRVENTLKQGITIQNSWWNDLGKNGMKYCKEKSIVAQWTVSNSTVALFNTLQPSHSVFVMSVFPPSLLRILGKSSFSSRNFQNLQSPSGKGRYLCTESQVVMLTTRSPRCPKGSRNSAVGSKELTTPSFLIVRVAKHWINFHWISVHCSM